MKLSNFLFASTASLALAAPPAVSNQFCGQYATVSFGSYTVFNNLWGKDSATSGGQCTGIDSTSGNVVKWHTNWHWTGGDIHVKSYANAKFNIRKVALSAIKSLYSTYSWSYSGTNINANVAYDLFIAPSPEAKAQNEVMIWTGSLGPAKPIGSTYAPVTISGYSWELYQGQNRELRVFSFVRVGRDINDFDGDLNLFLQYLTTHGLLPGQQYLVGAGAGTEAFTGTGKLVVTAYSLTQT